MENLAAAPFWTDIGIRSAARIKRRRDVEYVSEIFLLTMHGVQDSNPRLLDEYYARYDEEESADEIEEYRALYEKCLAIMRHLGVEFLKSSRFSNMHDFYSLWAASFDYADRANEIDYEATCIELKQFEKWLAELNESLANSLDIAHTHRDALKYFDAVRLGANKLTNRQIRAQILAPLIRFK